MTVSVNVVRFPESSVSMFGLSAARNHRRLHFIDKGAEIVSQTRNIPVHCRKVGFPRLSSVKESDCSVWWVRFRLHGKVSVA